MFKLRRIHGQPILIPVGATPLPAYFLLNEVAAIIWELYSQGKECQLIVDELLLKFPDVDKGRLSSDVSSACQSFSEITGSGSYTKSLFSQSEKEFRHRMSLNQIPITGTLELTFRCNLKCAHCYCVHEKIGKKELETGQVINILDQIAEAGCIWLLITGGEPLLRKDFEEIYLHAKELGLVITLFTNGILIDEHYAKLFSRFPPHLIEISLYGSCNDTYYSLCGAKKGYTNVSRALDLLDSNNISYRLKSFITSVNKHDFTEIKAISESRNKEFRFDSTPIYSVGGKPVPSGIPLEIGETIALESENQGSATEYSAIANRFASGRLFYCEAGNTSFNIDPHGYVSLCSRARVPSYDVNTCGFAAAWQKLIKAANRSIPSDFGCPDCSLQSYCRTCPAAANMDYLQKNREFCSYAEARMRAVKFEK